MIASTPQWISAISTALLGVIGLAFTIAQFRSSGFRPKVSARLDIHKRAIEVAIVNRGRGSGVVNHVDVLRTHTVKEKAAQLEFRSYHEGAFAPTELPAFSAMKLIIVARDGFRFTLKHRIRVEWATGSKVVTPLPVWPSLFTLDSVLPPSH